MKRSPLRRKTPLVRRKPMRRGRRRNSYARRERFVPYMLFVRSLPCAVWSSELDLYSCEGSIQADHAGPRPFGRKCSDHETIPLCEYHHRCRAGISGPFEGWGREGMRAWVAHIIVRVQLTWAEGRLQEAA